MTRRRVADALPELARLHGIQRSYTDIFGRRRTASREAVRSLLAGLGVAVGSDADAASALAAERDARLRRPLEPVTVAWRGRPSRLRLRLPARSVRARVVLRDEAGGERTLDLDLRDLAEAEGGAGWVVRDAPLPSDLDDGYHRAEVEGGGVAAQALVIRAPARAWQPQRDDLWGVFAPAYALRSHAGAPVGTLADLDRLGAWAADLGAGLVATLPLLAAFLDEPCDPSPYSPVSRLHWNELLLDLERAGVRDLPAEARAGAPRAGELIDYRAVAALRRAALEPLVEQLHERRHEELEAFARERPDVARYARFRAVHERRREPWGSWPARLRDGELRAGDADPAAERYHLAVQWLAERQLDELSRAGERRGQLLYFDLPLGVHPDGYDTWAFRCQFALGVSTGSPPDEFFTGGQDWGFAPLHPQAARQAGHAYTIACIRHHLRRARVLRIDHVMGLHRLFWIPRGLGAAQGAYVRYPADELYAVLTLESHRHRALVVGENLGTVPAAVDRTMARRGLRGMYVGQYRLHPGPEPVDPGSLASLNTHDAPPFAAFWHADDVDDRLDLGLTSAGDAQREREERARTRDAIVASLRRDGLLDGAADDPASVMAAWVAFLARSQAGIVLVTLEDLWLERLPQNVPGTAGERPNWRRRARYSLDDLFERPEPAALLRSVERLRREAALPEVGPGA